MINELLDAGNDVEIIPDSNIPNSKTPDFYVNGVKTELKTLFGSSLNTPVTGIQEGFIPGDGEMARMVCTCGALLSNHKAPNDIQLRVYTDEEWEKIFDCDSIHPWMIPLPKYDVWRCPVCKSIYVYEGSKEAPIMTYRLET